MCTAAGTVVLISDRPITSYVVLNLMLLMLLVEERYIVKKSDCLSMNELILVSVLLCLPMVLPYYRTGSSNPNTYNKNITIYAVLSSILYRKIN